MGCKSVLQVFCKRSNFKGTICFSTGVFFVASGLPVLGMMLETLGIFLLLRSFCFLFFFFLTDIACGNANPC
ncbi:unnamed protein product [Arabidopsis halleri]